MRFSRILLLAALAAHSVVAQGGGTTGTLDPETGTLPSAPPSNTPAPTTPDPAPADPSPADPPTGGEPSIPTPIDDPPTTGEPATGDPMTPSEPTEPPTNTTLPEVPPTVNGTQPINGTLPVNGTLPEGNTTTTDPANWPLDVSAQDWNYPGELVEPYTPPDVAADQALIELAYIANISGTDECLARARQPDMVEAMRRRAELEEEPGYMARRALLPTLCLPPYQMIDISFHWLAGDEAGKVIVDAAALDNEIKILREKFAKMRILFRVQQRQVWTGTATRNVFWQYSKQDYARAYALMGQYKRRLGTYKRDHLNIFLVNSITSGGEALGGTCTFPTAGREPQDGDGCILDVASLTGHKTRGNKFRSLMGHALVHEVGHWLDLRHPFQGGCRGTDGVRDTLQYPEMSFESRQKACTRPTAEPVRNPMAYTFAFEAPNVWTPGQMSRAHASLIVTRRGARQVPPCQFSVRRDEVPASRPWRRQSPEGICAQTQLVLSNFDAAPLTLTGFFNEDSPPITGGPAVLAPDASVAAGAQPQGASDGGKLGAVGGEIRDNNGAVIDSGATTSSSGKPSGAAAAAYAPTRLSMAAAVLLAAGAALFV